MEGFIGEIRMIAYNRAPRHWAICAGQYLPINQNQALYSILGTTYGGDGVTSFALPDLRGRVPMGTDGHWAGQMGGQRAVTLGLHHLPSHTHVVSLKGVRASALGTAPVGNLPAVTQVDAYGREGDMKLASQAVSSVGSGHPHTNVQPSLGVNFIICLNGYYPSMN